MTKEIRVILGAFLAILMVAGTAQAGDKVPQVPEEARMERLGDRNRLNKTEVDGKTHIVGYVDGIKGAYLVMDGNEYRIEGSTIITDQNGVTLKAEDLHVGLWVRLIFSGGWLERVMVKDYVAPMVIKFKDQKEAERYRAEELKKMKIER